MEILVVCRLDRFCNVARVAFHFICCVRHKRARRRRLKRALRTPTKNINLSASRCLPLINTPQSSSSEAVTFWSRTCFLPSLQMRASRSRSTTVTAAYNNVPTDQNTPASPVPHMPAPAKHANFDNVLQRLHKLSIATASEPRSPLSPLGPAFSLSDAGSFQDREKAATNFAPRPAPALNLSPQSSTSSCSEFSSVSSVSSHDVFDAFVRTQSRVVRVSVAFFVFVLARN